MMDRLYYSIAEVAQMFNVNHSLLRFWEKEFECLTPKKNSKGTRFYTQEDIETIKTIRYLLKDQKLTVSGAKQRMKNNKNDIERKRKIVEKLKTMRTELVAIRKELNQEDAIQTELVDLTNKNDIR